MQAGSVTLVELQITYHEHLFVFVLIQLQNQ